MIRYVALLAYACAVLFAGPAAAQVNSKIGVYRAAPPTLTDGQAASLRLDASGALAASGNFGLLGPLPAGSNVIGAVTQSGAPWSVTASVSNFPASQAVTNTGTFAVQNTAVVVGGNATAVKTDGSGTTQPVSAASLPLPAGASTSAAQSTGNTSLASIDTKTPTLGTQARSASRSVTPASDLANIEPAGTPITGTAMPAGGTGLTGWLSALYAATAPRTITFFDNGTVPASGQLGGNARDAGSPNLYTRFTAAVSSTVAGTVQVRSCTDSGCAIYAVVASQPVAAGGNVAVTGVLVGRYAQGVVINGGAAAGTAQIFQSFTQN